MRAALLALALIAGSALGQIPERAVVQLARGKAVVSSQVATILLKAPTDRKLNGGTAWFETHHPDDYIEVYVTDEDNILGLGAGTVVGGYTDAAVPAANRGWYFEPDGTVQVTRIADLGSLKGGLYVKVIGHKGDSTADTLRINLFWGTPY